MDTGEDSLRSDLIDLTDVDLVALDAVPSEVLLAALRRLQRRSAPPVTSTRAGRAHRWRRLTARTPRSSRVTSRSSDGPWPCRPAGPGGNRRHLHHRLVRLAHQRHRSQQRGREHRLDPRLQRQAGPRRGLVHQDTEGLRLPALVPRGRGAGRRGARPGTRHADQPASGHAPAPGGDERAPRAGTGHALPVRDLRVEFRVRDDRHQPRRQRPTRGRSGPRPATATTRRLRLRADRHPGRPHPARHHVHRHAQRRGGGVDTASPAGDAAGGGPGRPAPAGGHRRHPGARRTDASRCQPTVVRTGP